MIVINSGSQLSEFLSVSQMSQVSRIVFSIVKMAKAIVWIVERTHNKDALLSNKHSLQKIVEKICQSRPHIFTCTWKEDSSSVVTRGRIAAPPTQRGCCAHPTPPRYGCETDIHHQETAVRRRNLGGWWTRGDHWPVNGVQPSSRPDVRQGPKYFTLPFYVTFMISLSLELCECILLGSNPDFPHWGEVWPAHSI